jgi:hypothetical protein
MWRRSSPSTSQAWSGVHTVRFFPEGAWIAKGSFCRPGRREAWQRQQPRLHQGYAHPRRTQSLTLKFGTYARAPVASQVMAASLFDIGGGRIHAGPPRPGWTVPRHLREGWAGRQAGQLLRTQPVVSGHLVRRK